MFEANQSAIQFGIFVSLMILIGVITWLKVRGAAERSDDATKTDFLVRGTERPDTISIQSVLGGSIVAVVNGVNSPQFRPTGRIVPQP